MKWGAIAFAVFVVLGIIGNLIGGDETETATAADETTTTTTTTSAAQSPSTAPEATTPTPEPTPSPEPAPSSTTAPKPVPAPVDPVQQQQDDLADAIGDEVDDAQVTFRDAQVDVTFPIADNLTKGFIISGAQQDTIKILRAVKESGWGGGAPTVTVSGTFNMVDAYGGESTDSILQLTYGPGAMQRINPDGLQGDRVWKIADESFVHPELRK